MRTSICVLLLLAAVLLTTIVSTSNPDDRKSPKRSASSPPRRSTSRSRPQSPGSAHTTRTRSPGSHSSSPGGPRSSVCSGGPSLSPRKSSSRTRSPKKHPLLNTPVDVGRRSPMGSDESCVPFTRQVLNVDPSRLRQQSSLRRPKRDQSRSQASPLGEADDSLTSGFANLDPFVDKAVQIDDVREGTLRTPDPTIPQQFRGSSILSGAQLVDEKLHRSEQSYPEEEPDLPAGYTQRSYSSTIPRPNTIYYEPETFPVIDPGQFPPPYDPADAQKLFVLQFSGRAQFKLATAAKTYKEELITTLRLPYQFRDHGHLDCADTRSPLSDYIDCTYELGKSITLFGNSKINLVMETIDGVEQRSLQLPFFDAHKQRIFHVKTFVITGYEESDVEDTYSRYGYNNHVIVASAPIPFNAYTPYSVEAKQPVDLQPKDGKEKKPSGTQFSIAWTPGSCVSRIFKRRWTIEEKCKSPVWVIHGLFTSQYIQGSFMETLGEQVDEQEMRAKGLHRVWFNCERHYSDKGLWHHEWVKHGRHMGFAKAADYFTSVMDLFNRNDVQAILTYIGNHASDMIQYDVVEFKDKFFKHFRVLVSLRCLRVSPMHLVLTEVKICLDGSAPNWRIKSCPKQEDGCYFPNNAPVPRNARGEIVVPRTLRMFPYIMFTVTWLPSQLFRLRSRLPEQKRSGVNYPSSQRWIIHSLCPHLQYQRLSVAYKAKMWYMRNFDQPYHQYKTVLGQAVYQQLEFHWPTLRRDLKQQNHWYFWYMECGVILRSMNIPLVRGTGAYFSHSLALMNQLQPWTWLEGLLLPTIQPTQYVQQLIESKIGGLKIALLCYKVPGYDYPSLVKVRVCYSNRAEMEQIDCPQSASDERIRDYKRGDQLEDTNCGEDLYIPAQ